jgi:two-component system OmpR family response regulator
LVVDDDPDIRDLLAGYLRRHGFRVSAAADGEGMMALLERSAFDLVVLDIMMPGEDGMELCRRLRSGTGDRALTPVIFLTALGETMNRVAGLDLGADDYMSKPFQPRELLARIRAVLRRAGIAETARETGTPEGRAYLFDGWTLDRNARHLLDPDGVVVNLSGAEFRLLCLFLQHPHKVLSRDFLQEQAQGREVDRSPFDRSLDVQVCRLRARLRDNGREAHLIKTVRGDGYVFACSVRAE